MPQSIKVGKSVMIYDNPISEKNLIVRGEITHIRDSNARFGEYKLKQVQVIGGKDHFNYWLTVLSDEK